MRVLRTNWLIGLMIASLAIVSALFVAHLGTHSHSDECHACEVLSHSTAVSPEIVALARAGGCEAGLGLAPPGPTLGSRGDDCSAPRAPPLS